MSNYHKQVWAKANILVDQGISGIISALSEFQHLETVESCEGNELNGPWVCFRYGSYWKNSWRELADFVLGYFSPRLIEAVGDDVSVKIQITPSGNIFGELSIRPGATSRVEAALWALARDSSARSLGCCDGTSDTSP